MKLKHLKTFEQHSFVDTDETNEGLLDFFTPDLKIFKKEHKAELEAIMSIEDKEEKKTKFNEFTKTISNWAKEKDLTNKSVLELIKDVRAFVYDKEGKYHKSRSSQSIF
jgi:hypothetical protein